MFGIKNRLILVTLGLVGPLITCIATISSLTNFEPLMMKIALLQKFLCPILTTHLDHVYRSPVLGESPRTPLQILSPWRHSMVLSLLILIDPWWSCFRPAYCMFVESSETGIMGAMVAKVQRVLWLSSSILNLQRRFRRRYCYPLRWLRKFLGVLHSSIMICVSIIEN